MTTSDLVSHVISDVVFRIIESYFSGDASSHKCFRVKNLRQSEILVFLDTWSKRNEESGLSLVRVVISSDAADEYPAQYRAEPGLSITWYRNNNEGGLVYVETKIESDEQGLKNIFTLQDRNFLDDYFTEQINVPEAIIDSSWRVAGGLGVAIPASLNQLMIEVLNNMHPQMTQVPVRNFIAFTLSCCKDWVDRGDTFQSEEASALVGKNLSHLSLFPDEFWKHDQSDVRVQRRLEVNLSYSDLTTASGYDIEPDEVCQLCIDKRFFDPSGVEYGEDIQKFWRTICCDYAQYRTSDLRKEIPFHIFEQLFSKDVKGLKLGERIESEILELNPERLHEYHQLNVQQGLNKRLQQDAEAFLESESVDSLLSLADIITKQTRRLVEKVAYPVPEPFFNPFVKIAEVARGFYASYGESGVYKVHLRLGKGADCTSAAIGLFAFIFGPSLRFLADETRLLSCGFELDIDEELLRITPSPVVEESANFEVFEESELPQWHPIPLEFVLVRLEDGIDVESAGNFEWLPADYPYLFLLWARLSSKNIANYTDSIFLPHDVALEDWLLNLCEGVTTLKDFTVDSGDDVLASSTLAASLNEAFNEFQANVSQHGLSRPLIDEYVDAWSNATEKAKSECVPDGKVDRVLEFLITREIVEVFPNSRLLMLPSHPIRLRWIESYLSETQGLARKSLAGELDLNPQNDQLYLNWISSLTPHQQPPMAVSLGRRLLFAVGERGWCEEFAPLKSSDVRVGDGIVDFASVIEMARQVQTYLHAHPYKRDGLAIIVVTSHSGKLVAELIRQIRKSENSSTNISMHVVAPRSLWEEVIRHFEQLHMESRISEGNKLFPPLQLRLHEFGNSEQLPSTVSDLQFDIALVPSLLGGRFEEQHNTEPSEDVLGAFSPLLDRPTAVYGGEQGGEISVSMRPRTSDQIMNNWSTIAVRHSRLAAVSKQQPENTDFVEFRIAFQSASLLYGELHRLAHWVVMLERYITREQIEGLDEKPDILTVKERVGSSGLYTLLVSSSSGKTFIVNRLNRKLAKIIASSDIPDFINRSENLAYSVYEATRRVSPSLVLQAMGVSRATEEMLGLMIAMQVVEQRWPSEPTDGLTAWIALDEHPEWFSGVGSTRADLCRISLDRSVDVTYVDVLIVEGKFRQEYDGHGIEQVCATLDLVRSIIEGDSGASDFIDSELWREHLLSAIENVSPEARGYVGPAAQETSQGKYKMPESMRSDFRTGRFVLRSIVGVYSICIYTEEGSLRTEYAANETVHVVRSFKGQVAALLSGEVFLEKITHGTVPVLTESDSESVIEHDKDDSQKSSNSDSETIKEKSISAVLPSERVDISGSLSRGKLAESELASRYQLVLDKFYEFGVSVEQPADRSQRFVEGPASILYRLKPGQAVDPRRLFEKADVLKLALRLEQEQNIRFGNHRGFVTIDVPKKEEDRYFVDAKTMWARWNRPQSELAAPLGEDSFGNIVDLNFSSSNSPHLLIGGTTGSGKSEALNTIIDGLLKYYSSKELRILLVDPKGTELQQYEGDEHLEGAVGWDDADATEILEKAVAEMQLRYTKLKDKKTRSLPEYNQLVSIEDRIPWWLIVLDEYADLTSDKEGKKVIEAHLKRLAQKARAAGIHVIIATQKPSAEVISTNLRSNLPAQLALRVKSSTESRVIIDEVGAETLNGKGDALLKSEGKVIRIQCAKT